jgi:hypothetical protein
LWSEKRRSAGGRIGLSIAPFSRRPLSFFEYFVMSVKSVLRSSLMVCALSPAIAAAQTTTPPPGTEPEPPAAPVRSERVAPAAAAPAMPWSVNLGVQQTYEGGRQFTGSGNAGIWGSRVTGSVGRTFTLKRGAIDVHGDATKMFSQSTSQSGQLLYGAGLGVGYSLTRRVTFHASQGLSSSLAQDSPVLVDAGRVFEESTAARTMVTSGDLVYQMSERNTMRVEAAQTMVGFQGSSLTSGNSTTARFNFSRQVHRSQSVGFSVGHTFTSGQTGDIQGVLATYQATLGRYLSVNASGGIRPYTLANVPGYHFAPGGAVSLSASVANQSVSFSYERAIEQAYGYDEALGGGLTHSANRVNSDYGVAIGQRLAVNVNGSYGMNTYPQIPGYHIGGRTLMVTSRYLLARQLSLGVAYGVWWRSETGAPTTATGAPVAGTGEVHESTSRATFSLTYAFGWR